MAKNHNPENTKVIENNATSEGEEVSVSISPIVTNNYQSDPISSNPSISHEILDEEIEKIKGDAIGDTLYSTRFVLKTLIKLTKLEENDLDFEKDLCTLWDMTIEKDVVNLLLDQNVLEIFSTIIDISNDQRLIEILVGIISNLCSVSRTRHLLSVNDALMNILLNLISCSDTLVLLQLMRFINATLVFENNVSDEITWFMHFQKVDNFIEKFSFILNNSMSSALLTNTLEALNAICTKFVVLEVQDITHTSFCNFIVTPTIISGTIEAFQQLIPSDRNSSVANDSCTDNEISIPAQSHRRVMNTFLDIHVILSQYDKISKKCYTPLFLDFFQCLQQILEPHCQEFYLLPVTVNEQGVIESINEIFQSLGDPFDNQLFAQILKIWSILDRHCKDKKNKHTNKSEWDAEDVADNDVNIDDINMTLLELITRLMKDIQTETITNAMKLYLNNNQNDVINLYNTFSAGKYESDIQECCKKLNLASQNIWNIDLSSKNSSKRTETASSSVNC